MLLVASLVLASPFVAAQDAASAAWSAHAVWREGGQLFGAGLGYRVEFSADSAVYVPALPDARRTYPLRFTLEGVDRGGHEIAFVAHSRPADADGTVVTYDRGPLIERWTLGPDGVEQSFVLPAPLPGKGDLVLRQRLTSELVARDLGDCSPGFELRDPEGVGGVAIGRAVAVDAAGNRTALRMAFDGTWLEIRAAERILESAVYPLVLDPPIGTVLSIGSTNGDIDPDVAWDETHQRYLAVWSRRLSASESEVFAQLRTRTGVASGPLIAIRAGGSVFATNAVVANIDVRDRFCVLWQEAPSPFGPFELHCRTVEAGSAATGNTVRITSGHNDVDPDIAGAVGGSSRAMVVWHRSGTGLRSAALAVPSVGNPSASLGLAVVTSNPDSVLPAITKSTGANGVPVLVWEQTDRIHALALDSSGRPRGNDLVIAGTSSPTGKPDIDGDGQGGYFVAFERRESQGSSHDVFGRALRFDGTTIVGGGGLVAIEADASDDEITPAVGYMAGKYLVACADNGGAFLDYDIVLQAVSPEGVACGPRTVARDSNGVFDAYPEIGTQFSGGGTGDEALVVFSALDHSSFATSVHGQRYEAFVGDGALVRRGNACGSGGTIDANGPVAVGNVLFGLELNGAAAQSGSAILLVALPGPTQSCGSCSLIAPFNLLLTPLQGGSAAVAIPLPCALGTAVGAQIEVQWLTVGSATPCPAFPGLAASDRLQLTLGR